MRIILVSFLIVVVGAGLIIFTKEPRNDRTWLSEYEKTATANITESSITIHNVRDWTYGQDILSDDWVDMTVQPETIVQAWYLIEPFGGFEGVGHTFLSFEFEDGRTLSFSIQARQEEAEKYSALRGLFNTYELAYQWGTERDLITRRLLYLKHELRMYPLTIERKDAAELFRYLVKKTVDISKEPKFYNTLTANCTNLLAKIVNERYPNKLPYDISWNLTGYSDLYLMKQNFIDTKESQEATRHAWDLTPFKEEIQQIATSSPREFSRSIRLFLNQ